MSRLLLEAGEVSTADNRDALIEQLEGENTELRQQLRTSQAEAAQLKRANEKAVSKLRAALAPIYGGMKELFGEMDAIAPGTETASSNPRWESWKQRMPGRPAEFIDLLLLHGSMSVKQFMAAAHCGKDAVYQVMSKMGQAGIVTNNGGRYSLKEL